MREFAGVAVASGEHGFGCARGELPLSGLSEGESGLQPERGDLRSGSVAGEPATSLVIRTHCYSGKRRRVLGPVHESG